MQTNIRDRIYSNNQQKNSFIYLSLVIIATTNDVFEWHKIVPAKIAVSFGWHRKA